MSMIIIHNFVLHKLLLFGNFSWPVTDFQVKRLFNGKSFQRVCGTCKTAFRDHTETLSAHNNNTAAKMMSKIINDVFKFGVHIDPSFALSES